VALLVTGIGPATSPISNFDGIWHWGSSRRSADVAFLRISRRGSELLIETKHYMHDNFVSKTKDVRVFANHLTFTYWYEPLHREANCKLDLVVDMMVGECEGERNAREWGSVATYLWRAR